MKNFQSGKSMKKFFNQNDDGRTKIEKELSNYNKYGGST